MVGMQLPLLVCAGAAAGTLLIRACAFRFGWFGTVLRHHTHSSPVPRLGGIAVFVSVLLAVLFDRRFFAADAISTVVPIVVAATPVLLIGLYDDLKSASPFAKIAAQLVGAAALIGLHAFLRGPVGMGEVLVLPVWLVVAANAFNVVDGVDGLAGGSAVIIAAALAIVNLTVGHVSLAALSIVLFAAVLGFMPFNFLRSRIFLGDSGSLTLGFMLAAIAFETPTETPFPWTAMVIFGYPLAEATLTVMRRSLKGRSVLHPDREHLHHKMLGAGFGLGATICLLCVVALAFSALGVMLALSKVAWPMLVGSAILLLAIAKSFGYLRARNFATLYRRMATSTSVRLPIGAEYLPAEDQR